MTGERSQPGAQRQNISASGAPGEGHGAESLPPCGDFQMRIARDGTWYYRGTPIGRKPLVKLFSTVLRRDEAGDYWLVTPVERGRITVDDAPFTAVEMRATGAGSDQVLSFRTNVDEWVEADSAHPIRVAEAPDSGEPSPYILVRDRLEALIVRSVFYDLVELAESRVTDGEEVLGVWSKASFFPLGKVGGKAGDKAD